MSLRTGRIIQFIRVGVDSGCGGRQSRVFPDRHYHFITIPKHNDPEFCGFTYGDMASNKNGTPVIKGLSLLKLRRGDFLVFYAGFENEDARVKFVGVFAYLMVKQAYLFSRRELPKRGLGLSFAEQSRDYNPFESFKRDGNTTTWKQVLTRYRRFSEHVSKSPRKEMELLICGERRRSRLLTKAQILAHYDLSKRAYITSTKIAERFGLKYEANLTRSSVRTVHGELAARSIEQLEKLA